jgi:kynurenine formamidase
VQEVEVELARIGHALSPLEIVLVRTGRDAGYGTLEYLSHGPGVSAEATRWLHAQGVRVMGIDAWGWDRPLVMQAEDARRDQRPGIFWAAHQVDLSYAARVVAHLG